jgi:hypothetical protein
MLTRRERAFFIQETHRDRIRVWMVREGPQLVDFLVQYEGKFNDQWEPVIRYDQAHGFLHRDRIDPRGELDRKDRVPYGNLKDALTEAIRELRANWPEYRRWYRERRR